MMGNKKIQVWLPLIFALVMVAGMFFGYRLGSPSQKGSQLFTGGRSGTLQEALDLIRLKYVDSVQVDSLEGSAILEMINHLDPHSVYLPPVDLKVANEDLAGNFEGIGVEFDIFNDTVHVLYVFPGGPSDRGGLQISDKIVAVNGISLTGKSISSEKIRNSIRGERGSTAALTIIRNGKSIPVNIIRGTIPVPVVDAAYMIDKKTGYIKLSKFTENSYEEFMAALEKLKKEGMESLIFDLRGNGGGFMNEAVDMADEFLDGDKLIVYTQGINNKRREYRCKRPGLFETGKLVLLVDELSASASEVLAGALQDWCRATVIGRRTFGKGLVQEQYYLSDGSALRLTVARYYSPLGRSIQRPYHNGKKVYMDELWDRVSSGEAYHPDSARYQNGKPFYNSCRDTLYGGGGISPNIMVPLDSNAAMFQVFRLINRPSFSKYIYSYYLANQQKIDGYKSPEDFIRNYDGMESMWKGLSGQLSNDSINFTAITTREKEFITLRLKALLARYHFRNNGFYQVLNSKDPMVEKALQTLK